MDKEVSIFLLKDICITRKKPTLCKLEIMDECILYGKMNRKTKHCKIP